MPQVLVLGLAITGPPQGRSGGADCGERGGEGEGAAVDGGEAEAAGGAGGPPTRATGGMRACEAITIITIITSAGQTLRGFCPTLAMKRVCSRNLIET